MQQLLVWELSGHSSFKGILEERERANLQITQEELNKSLDTFTAYIDDGPIIKLTMS